MDAMRTRELFSSRRAICNRRPNCAAESRWRWERATTPPPVTRKRAKRFARSRRSSSPLTQDAFYNATLAWMEAGDETKVDAALKDAPQRGLDENARGNLQLEAALLAASRKDAKAAELLRAFVNAFPQHPRISEAHVALAEWAFHAAPPQLKEAREALERASASQPTAAAVERGDYLRIWLEDAASRA